MIRIAVRSVPRKPTVVNSTPTSETRPLQLNADVLSNVAAEIAPWWWLPA